MTLGLRISISITKKKKPALYNGLRKNEKITIVNKCERFYSREIGSEKSKI